MNKTAARATLFLILSLIWLVTARAGEVYDGHVRARLIADVQAVVTDQPFWVGLRMVMDDGWHTYWRNSGDSGMPTSIQWELPDGFSAGELHWPAPQYFDYGNGLAGYGYEGEVILLTEITPPEIGRHGGSIPIGAKVKWLSCEEICVPGKAALTLELGRSSNKTPGPEEAMIYEQMKSWPLEGGLGTATVLDEGDQLVLKIVPDDPDTFSMKAPRFFPYRNDVIDHVATQVLDQAEGGYWLSLVRSTLMEDGLDIIEGVLVDEDARAWEISAPLQ